MGIGDKAKSKAEELAGKGKEGLGEATDNDELRREGQADQAKAKAKQAGENVKDAARDAKDAAGGLADRGKRDDDDR